MTLTKTGAGTQILSGTNTYSGGTTLSVGMLHFGRLVSQPASGAVAIGTGGTLAVNVGGTGEWTTGTSGNGTIGGLLGGLGGQSGGTVSYYGNVALGFDTTNGFANPNGIATQTYSGAIANVGTTLGITKLGTNILFLSGDNTYAGATTVNAGRLVLTGTNSYTGGSFINGGMLQFGKLTAQPASGAVAVATGTTLAVNLGGPANGPPAPSATAPSAGSWPVSAVKAAARSITAATWRLALTPAMRRHADLWQRHRHRRHHARHHQSSAPALWLSPASTPTPVPPRSTAALCYWTKPEPAARLLWPRPPRSSSAAAISKCLERPQAPLPRRWVP